MRHPSLSVRECLAVVLALLGASLAATWPVVIRAGSSLPGDLGDPLLNTWILAWDASRLPHGLQGVWDAPIFYPALRTLTWSEHLLGIAVPLAPLQWLTRNPVLVYNTAFIGSYVLAGFGGYLLCREIGLGRPAAMVGGAACAFAPYRADEITHLQVLMTGWAPIALAACHRFAATGSYRAATVFAVTFALLALSNTYFLFFFTLPVVLIWLYTLGWAPVRRRVIAAGTALAGALMALLVGPVMFAYWRTRQTAGLVRAWDEIADLSARPADYMSVAGGSWLWSRILPVAPAEHALFPGVIIALLAAVGFLYAARALRHGSREVCAVPWLYLATLGLAVWGTFGPRGGLYAVALHVVPGLEGLRMVTRLFAVSAVALAVLAAFGFDRMVVARPRRQAGFAAAACAALIFIEGLTRPLGAAPFDPRLPPEVRPMYAWLRQQPEGAVLELPIDGPALGEHTLLYQYASLGHRHPIMNGYSGSGSALQDFLASRASPVYEAGRLPDLLAALRAMGVRYVIVHPKWLASQTRANWLMGAMESCGDQVASVFYGGDAVAWTLQPAPAFAVPAETGTPIATVASTSYSVKGVQGPMPEVTDNDVSTRWSTSSPQHGGEWLRIDFSSPIDARRITLDLAWRRAAEYPRALTIESIGSDGTTRVLSSGSTLRRFLPALLAPGPAVPLAIWLPENHSTAIVLRQTETAPAAWSVNELRVWRAR